MNTHCSEHFTYQELACHHCGRNECTPELIGALEELRAIIDRPLVIHSAYRCPEHNREVGGASYSEHVKGNAADLSVVGWKAVDIYQAALKVPSIRGLGVDWHKQYVHVDVRMQLAQWTYYLDGKQAPWIPIQQMEV